MIFAILIVVAALIVAALCIGHDIQKGLDRIANAIRERSDT